MTPDEFRAAAHGVVGRVADYLAGLQPPPGRAAVAPGAARGVPAAGAPARVGAPAEGSNEEQEQAEGRGEADRRGLGLVVLRVPNDELLHNREGVLETVLREADASLTSRPSP